MAGRTVKEVLELIRGYGLDIAQSSGSAHYQVRDPNSGMLLFTMPHTPSDYNWHWSVMRHLRRLGYIIDGKQRSRKQRGRLSVDLGALKIAQERAASAGEHVPTLDDLENTV